MFEKEGRTVGLDVAGDGDLGGVTSTTASDLYLCTGHEDLRDAGAEVEGELLDTGKVLAGGSVLGDGGVEFAQLVGLELDGVVGRDTPLSDLKSRVSLHVEEEGRSEEEHTLNQA